MDCLCAGLYALLKGAGEARGEFQGIRGWKLTENRAREGRGRREGLREEGGSWGNMEDGKWGDKRNYA